MRQLADPVPGPVAAERLQRFAHLPMRPGSASRSHPFIERVQNGEVTFHNKRRRSGRDLAGVKVENARWMGGVLKRLSEKQLSDAFRAGGFDDGETAKFVRAIRSRISQLLSLK